MFNTLKMNVCLPVCLILSLLILSCQSNRKSETNQQLLEAEVYLRYLQSEKQLKAEISFFVVDSTKKMMPKMMDEVLFHKKVMSGKKVQNLFRYQLIQTGSLVEKYNFEYSHSGKPLQEQNIFINPIEDYFIKGEIISKSSNTTIVFKGKLLKSNENLILLFSDDNNKVSTVAIAGPSSSLGISILPKQIKELALGKGKLYMVRRQTINAKTETFNLTGLTEYYSKVIDIEVIE